MPDAQNLRGASIAVDIRHQARILERPVTAAPERVPLSVYCMALGTFAIGTEVYMIAPLLPRMATDFGRSVSAVAMLITIFTLVLAITSPILTVLSATVNRKRLLLSALGIFAIGNIFAWQSTSFTGILVARIILAVAAGLYVPNASALAGSIVAPNHRATALAIVNSGTTFAVALGLPLGAVVGNAFGWRATFLTVGIMAIIATFGIGSGVPQDAGAGIRVPGFKARLSAATNPRLVLSMVVMLLWAASVYTAYPVIATYLSSVAALSPWGITAILSLWGVSAAAGLLVSGRLTDRFGSTRVIPVTLFFGTIAFLYLAGIAFVRPPNAIPLVAVGLVVWGFSAWAFTPALMSRLVRAGGVEEAPVALSLNYSIMYAGFAIGSAIGAHVLASGFIPGIDLTAAAVECGALLFFLATKGFVDGKRAAVIAQ